MSEWHISKALDGFTIKSEKGEDGLLEIKVVIEGQTSSGHPAKATISQYRLSEDSPIHRFRVEVAMGHVSQGNSFAYLEGAALWARGFGETFVSPELDAILGQGLPLLTDEVKAVQVCEWIRDHLTDEGDIERIERVLSSLWDTDDGDVPLREMTEREQVSEIIEVAREMKPDMLKMLVQELLGSDFRDMLRHGGKMETGGN